MVRSSRSGRGSFRCPGCQRRAYRPDRLVRLEIQPGSAAAVVVYENRWVFSVVNAWRRAGARLIADGGLSPDEVIAALDATEPA